LGTLVARDSRVASILEGYGIDYCCRGNRSLAEAVKEKHVRLEAVVSSIERLGHRPGGGEAREWASPEDLARHIVDRHHRYVREMAPVISGWLAKIRERHGARHPELEAVSDAFEALTADLSVHMLKEEHVLFPYITALARASRTHDGPVTAPFGTVRHPVRLMEDDHRLAGVLMARVRSLTHDYESPDDACRTYTLCLAELATFERDLHRHIHLENNVLFPRAIELEDRAART
jgi:regulator of cell morphogenesis and NO signaling